MASTDASGATPPPAAGATSPAPAGADTLPASAARLRVALVRLSRALRQRGNVGNHLTATLLGALGTVETRGPITLGELAAAEDVQPPTMTRVVGKLEERGLVHREADPADRRVARVRVTDAGRALIAESRTRRDAFLAQRLATLTPEEVAAIEAALPVLERLACMPVKPVEPA
jgi:DNA-binding MarR family transcriptional regulator